MIEILRIFRRSKSREALQVQRFPAFVFQGTRGILPGLKSTGKKTVEPRHIYPLFVEKILSFEMDAKNRRLRRPRRHALLRAFCDVHRIQQIEGTSLRRSLNLLKNYTEQSVK